MHGGAAQRRRDARARLRVRDADRSGHVRDVGDGLLEKLRVVAQNTTRHGKLTDYAQTIEGNHIGLGFDIHVTGDASGQDMVQTIATDAICQSYPASNHR